MDRITAFDARVYRGDDGIWRHSDSDQPVPGARDMTLRDIYPDLVVVGSRKLGNQVVLVPDPLVRENADLAWVRDVATGPTRSYDHEQRRGFGATPGWSDVWPVPIAEWDGRAREALGIMIDDWTDGEELPR
ncbi:hypothetical protein MSIMFB_04434 [Mycobacterium simulans]|uniref:Uncharacterized protein n=2 Tax=Mycobacterium simulans TaxID=627089 RepID=A0A7Z7IQP9_9MYCO|nr:hypothetical protein [Mycobacterium riyadhense]SOJ56956.1 hypothetical protein MSIMFB_04434 [Mycobacterium simulans]